MTYPAYEKYKESGVPWLGDVPEGWDVKRLRFLLSTNPQKSKIIATPETPVSFIIMDAVGEDGGLRLDTEKPMDEVSDGYTYFAENDVVVAKITPCFENGKGALAKGLTNGIAFGTTELHVLRASECLSPEYLFLLTTTYPFRNLGESEMYGAGGQKRVPESFIKDFVIGIPPLPEQKSITEFLDTKTAEIDALVAKKQELLKLLTEQRTALITHAVTKGLNPSAPMKDSGIDWLGHIPQHWEAIRLRFLLSDPLKYGANESAEFEDRSDPRYIRITDVKEDGSLKEETFKSLPEEVAHPYILEDGDILLARSGATVGKTFIYRPSWGRAAYAGYLIRARISKKANADFIYCFLNSKAYWDWLNSIFIQATIQNVSAEKYASLWIPVPPLEEQQKILDYVDAKLKHINGVVEKTIEAIDRLKEYRTALITNAVTGKIDVRSYQKKQEAA